MDVKKNIIDHFCNVYRDQCKTLFSDSIRIQVQQIEK